MEKALQKEGLKMKKCTKCQKEFDWGVEVCPSCGKKVKNAKVELHLKNGTGKECTISCSEKIRLSPLQLYLELQYGIPAFNVKPVSGKDVAIALLLFASIFLVIVVFPNLFGVLLCIGLIVVNVIYTKDFYYNAVKKILTEGYLPVDDDTAAILKNAGFVVSTSTSTASSTAMNSDASSSIGKFEFCQSCGAKISSDAKFCPKCGTEKK